jgi:hypothetical protein
MCCCNFCVCFGCSECVGCYACNNRLCNRCLTGTQQQTMICAPTTLVGPTPGSCVAISFPATSQNCVDVSRCLPFAGTDENGNDIYQKDCGALVYSDGSTATQSDIVCNEGACRGTVCSPRTCGSTTQPVRATGMGSGSSSSPTGGGSGSGSAKSSCSKASCNSLNSALTAMQKSMNSLGATVTSLLTGGTKTAIANGAGGTIIGAPSTGVSCVMSGNAFLLVILIVGGLLLFLAFGTGRTA